MTYDVTELRSRFSSLNSGVAHFDAPGGTQTPDVVGEAIAQTLMAPLSNLGGGNVRSEANAETIITDFRTAFGDLLGASPSGIVYGRSTTQLNYDFSRALAKDWQPGDNIVVSRLDHDANVRPWIQAAESRGADVRWIDFEPATSEVVWDSVEAAIGPRTRVVAVTAASNLLGTKPPVRDIAEVAHAAGALVHVDAVHYAAHELVDLEGLGADSLVCSPYKFLGPHCAVLAAAPEFLESVKPDKLAPATDVVPERFELGTLPFETLAGATAAVNFLAEVSPGGGGSRRERLRASFDAIAEYEYRLVERVEKEFEVFGSRLVCHSRAGDRTPTLLFTFPGRRSWSAYEFLATKDVLAPADSFYAYETYRRLSLDDPHAMRLGMAPYVDDHDVDRLVSAIAQFLKS